MKPVNKTSPDTNPRTVARALAAIEKLAALGKPVPTWSGPCPMRGGCPHVQQLENIKTEGRDHE